MRRPRWAWTAALAACLIVACGSGNVQPGFCRAVDALVEDMDHGRLDSRADLRDRVSADTMGDPGGSLGGLRLQLENAVEAGDDRQVRRTLRMLEKDCVGVH